MQSIRDYKKMTTYNYVSRQVTKKTIEENCTKLYPNLKKSRFYIAKKPLYGFKKVYTKSSDCRIRGLNSGGGESCEEYAEALARRYCLGIIGSKMVSQQAIANIIVPVGPRVYLGANVYDSYGLYTHNKLRANKVLVHSIVRIKDKKQVPYGRSTFDSLYFYVVSKDIEPHVYKPKETFSMANKGCDSGIHFFLDLEAAIDY